MLGRLPTKVSAEDYEWAAGLPWYYNADGYVTTGSDGAEGRAQRRPGRMNRLVLERALGRHLRSDEKADHENRVKTDNRRPNIRSVTIHQNTMNLSPYRGAYTSKFKGVFWDKQKGKWRANIRLDGVRIYCGSSADELEAAYLYDQFAIVLFGRYAYLNVLDHEL